MSPSAGEEERRSGLRRVVVYGAAGGLLIALLDAAKYTLFIRSYPWEVYGGLVAVLFTVVGVAVGLKWARPQERVVVREVAVPERPFTFDEGKLRELGITAREFEILGLIARGLSNREIGELLFVSENTVKTHSSRLFMKMDVKRRVQAVQKARELGLIP